MTKIEIHPELSDKIVVTNLKDYRKLLKKELKAYEKGSYLHPEDVEQNKEIIKAINIILKQFGE